MGRSNVLSFFSLLVTIQLVSSQNNRLLSFVANSSHIVTFNTNRNDGSLYFVSAVPQASDSAWVSTFPYTNPEYLLATGNGVITLFSINPQSGNLTKRSEVNCSGINPAHASWSVKGTHVLVANYGDGDQNSTGASVAVFPVTQGNPPTLGNATAVLHHTGNGSNPDRQTGPHPHMITTDGRSNFVFNTDLGTNKIYQYVLQDNGNLTANTVATVNPAQDGDGPRHITFHPSLRYGYVINELTSSIDVYLYDSATGLLSGPVQEVSTLPPDWVGESDAAEIAVTPDGKYLYGSNRGYDSIVSFYIDVTSTDFHLKRLEWVTHRISTPRGFAIDPTGNLLIVGASSTGEIVSFRINPDTGILTPTGAVTSMIGAITLSINEFTN